MSARRAALGLLLLAASCAGTAGQRDWRTASAPAPGPPPALEGVGSRGPQGETLLGHVAGSPLTAMDLLEEWHETAPRELWLIVDRIVSTRLALLEAAELGVRLEPAVLATALAAERERQDAELARVAGGRSIESTLREELGQEPAEWYAALERRTIERLSVERVVRAWTLASPSRAVRVLALPQGDAVEAVRRRLAAGEDFVALVRELSVDDSRADDGLVPFLVDATRSPLGRVAFATAPGAVGGPVRTVGHDVLVRVEEVREPLEGDWDAVGPAVEASLARHPVQDAEYLPWKLAMRRRHAVDLGPLEKLFRAP